MTQRRIKSILGGAVALTLVLAACGGDDGDTATTAPPATDAPTDATDAPTDATDAPTDATDAPTDATDAPADGECESVDTVRLQLQWFTQAQFGGYYAAVDQGFYADQCLEVTILEGGVDIVPQTQLANGDADFAIAWVPKALQSREAGADIVNIAQVFQRSGTLQVSFVDRGITSPADFEGKKIGNWGFGNEYEVFAAITQAGLDPATDVELVAQQFDMEALLAGDIDAAEAMTYNEYAQVLEATNPDTGELYQPEDFNVISYEEVGVGMLQDAIWADGAKLASDEAYRDIAVRFVAASLQGWTFCRDNVEACRDIVVGAGSQLGNSHQLWQMNEVNKLIWPAPDGVGFIDADAMARTVTIAQETKNLDGDTVLTQAPDGTYFTNDILTEAWALLDGEGLDLFGNDFAPISVTLEPGGN
jgi:NitT/TauT family transport system substrate-binding protein